MRLSNNYAPNNVFLKRTKNTPGRYDFDKQQQQDYNNKQVSATSYRNFPANKSGSNRC